MYGFTAAKALVESVERSLDEFPPSVASNLEFLQQSRITDPVTNTTFLPASFLPGSLSEASWAPLRLTADDLRKAAGPDAAAVDEIELIELETQTLLVDRPWFWPALFENERWDWKNAAPPVSSGQPDPAGDTMVPAYVFALVFARYLLVKRRRTGGNQRSDPPSSRERLAGPLANLGRRNAASDNAGAPHHRPSRRRPAVRSCTGAAGPQARYCRSRCRARRPRAERGHEVGSAGGSSEPGP